MLEVISGIDSTVAVTSLRAYISLSAGAISFVCPANTVPTFLRILLYSFRVRFVLNPLIESSLSRVPPVCPNPLPEIIGTYNPAAATIGAIIKEVLSPTPPVECLSTFTPLIELKSTTLPLFSIVPVNAAVSSTFIPFR